MKKAAARMILVVTWPFVRLERLSIRYPAPICVLIGGAAMAAAVLPWWPDVLTFVAGMATVLIMFNARDAHRREGLKRAAAEKAPPALLVEVIVTDAGVRVDSAHDTSQLSAAVLAGALMRLAESIVEADHRAKADLN